MLVDEELEVDNEEELELLYDVREDPSVEKVEEKESATPQRSTEIEGRNLPSFEPKATININLRKATGTIRGTYTREELSL